MNTSLKCRALMTDYPWQCGESRHGYKAIPCQRVAYCMRHCNSDTNQQSAHLQDKLLSRHRLDLSGRYLFCSCADCSKVLCSAVFARCVPDHQWCASTMSRCIWQTYRILLCRGPLPHLFGIRSTTNTQASLSATDYWTMHPVSRGFVGQQWHEGLGRFKRCLLHATNIWLFQTLSKHQRSTSIPLG